MGADLKSNAIDTPRTLRSSKRATQFTGRFQNDPGLNAKPKFNTRIFKSLPSVRGVGRACDLVLG